MSKDELPTAVVVQDGKVPGDVPGAPPPAGRPRSRHQRKLANYILDKRLQLRYVLLVSIMSAMIAGTLGYLIYHQMHKASAEVTASLQALEEPDPDDPTATADSETGELARQIGAEMRQRDRALIIKMILVGIGLIVILSAYLVIMTHKVAGPLYKVSMYFDKMTEGRLGNVTPLRRGDMLTDFYDGFREMHGAVRGRFEKDAIAMQKLIDAARATGVDGELGKEVDRLSQHVAARKQALS